jgi:hypothetical protein
MSTYRRYKRYKPYKQKRRYYYNYNEPNLLDDLFEIILALMVMFGRLIGKLISELFKLLTTRKQTKISGTTINETVYPPKEEAQPQARPQIQTNVDPRYSLKPSLLTPAENEFLNILESIVSNRYRIECQVQISRFVAVNDSNAHFTNYHDFNRIKAKSIDFVLFDKTRKPCLAIELDDRTHSRLDRIKRDMFVDDVMEQIHLPILHVRVAYPHPYNVDELRQQIFSSLPTPDLDGSTSPIPKPPKNVYGA